MLEWEWRFFLFYSKLFVRPPLAFYKGCLKSTQLCNMKTRGSYGWIFFSGHFLVFSCIEQAAYPPFGCWSTALFLFCRTERDASNWSMDKLKTLFLAVRVQNEEGRCEVTEVNKLDGEASINNRKGKLIFFYEWNIKLNWTGESVLSCQETDELHFDWGVKELQRTVFEKLRSFPGR